MDLESPPSGRVLSVVRPDDPNGVVDALRAGSAFETFAISSVAELVDELDDDGRIDCVVCEYDVPDGTGVDVLERVLERRPAVPVVLFVEAADGRVPVGAVTDGFASRVVADGSDAATEALCDAVGTAVADRQRSVTLGRLPPPGWSDDHWKASVFDQLFENFPLHVFVKDREGRITHVTDGPVEERLHSSGDAFRGRRDVDGVVPFGEALDSYIDDLRVIDTGEAVVDEEEFFPSSGRWFLTTKIPLRDGGGDVVGLLGITREITERKGRERQLTALTHLVRHTLRNEVNVVHGWAERLHSSVDGANRSAAARILRAAERLQSMIDRQQEIADVVTDPPAPTTVDAAAVAQQVLTAAAERHPSARLESALPERAPVSAVDSLERALGELVQNAVIHNSRDAPLVELNVEPDGETVHIRVADDGPPIPEMEVATLTGERVIDPLTHGTGLGLWIVNWVVRRSNGTLSFTRNGSRGNVVTVTLPRGGGGS
ncbi:sensor histidine kinase [Salinigranum rubrum]|nr:PAS domain-containing sensor histidine kinase [Salinigranum rubrum]